MGSAAETAAIWWRHKGDSLRCAGDPRGALQAYGSALALDPFTYGAWLGKGRALEDLGQDEAALDHYDIAASLAPHSFAAHEAKGLLLHKGREFRRALACFEWAGVVAARNTYKAGWALNYQAATLIKLRRFSEALARCDAGLDLYALDVLWLTRGNALRALRRYDEAIASHDEALALNPTCAEARFNRGLVEEDQGRTRAAIRTYRRCLSLETLDPILEQRVRRRLADALHTQLRDMLDARSGRLFPRHPDCTAPDEE